MRKSLLPVAAILGWSVALAAVSSLEALDAERELPVSTAQLSEEPAGAGGTAEPDPEHAEPTQSPTR